MSDAEKSPESTKAAETVRYHLIKSPAFCTVHSDGAVGSLTPRGNFHLAFFAERPPIPQLVEYEIEDNGAGGHRLGKENIAARVSRDGFVRELQVDVVMSIQDARALRDLLQQQIAEAERLLGEQGQT